MAKADVSGLLSRMEFEEAERRVEKYLKKHPELEPYTDEEIAAMSRTFAYPKEGV